MNCFGLFIKFILLYRFLSIMMFNMLFVFLRVKVDGGGLGNGLGISVFYSSVVAAACLLCGVFRCCAWIFH